MTKRPGMTIAWWIIGIAVGLLALKLIIVWAEPYMAFVPRRGATPPPFGFQSVTLTIRDGTRLSGWKTELPSEGPVFLYLPGNAGNLSDREELMTRAARAGLPVIAFDYRGTGQSEGRETETRAHSDAVEIFDYITGSLNVDPQRLILWGHSIGGAVATELARKRRPAGLVLEGTFRSGLTMAKRMLPFLPVSWFMTYKFDNEANVAALDCPIFFVHGSEDFTIPARDSEYLHSLAEGRGELWIVPGADHNDVYEVAGTEFFVRLLQFGQRVTSMSLPAQSLIP